MVDGKYKGAAAAVAQGKQKAQMKAAQKQNSQMVNAYGNSGAAKAKLTPEQKAVLAKMTPEQKAQLVARQRAAQGKAQGQMTPQQKAQAAGKQAAQLTPEQKANVAAQQQAASQQANAQRIRDGEVNHLFQQARAAAQSNNGERAINFGRQALGMDPNHLPTLRLLASVRRSQGQNDVALQLLEKALQNNQFNDEVICDAAEVLESTGKIRLAEERFQKAARINPQNFRAQFALGRLFQRRGNGHQAEHHYRQAYYIQPGNGVIASNLAGILSNQGRNEEAERFYRIALAINPKDIGSLLGYVRLEESRQRLDKAKQIMEVARKVDSEFATIGITEALIHRREKSFDQAIESLDKVKVDKMVPGMQASYYYDRGQTMDKAKRYDDAMEAYNKANEINHTTQKLIYNEEDRRKAADRIKETFTRDKMKDIPRAEKKDPDMAEPVFICGFTRSGTSMMEQILSSHPAICAGDELHYVAELARRSSDIIGTATKYPENLLELNKSGGDDRIQAMRVEYINSVRRTDILEPGVKRFTDKMPMNEFNLGLIHLMFPESPVVHMVRHPFDAVLSTYFTDARHGGFCSYSLKSAATHYALLIELAEHYRKELDLKYLRTRYEDVVADIELESRKILKFIGEPWDPACLEFHKNERNPRTPSYAQVKEKLYTDSVYRYKNYRKHIDEIVPILESTVELLGYKIED